MNRALRVTAISMLMIGGAPKIGYADPKGTGRHVIIEIRNYAQIGGDVLHEATRITSYIFKEAGVEVTITNAAPGEEASIAGGGSRKIDRLQVNILSGDMSRRMGLPKKALGLAPGSSLEDDRTTVYIFGDVAETLAQEQGIADMGYILGHAVAHEIGHVLLNAANHAYSGIMQATWRENDFRAMTMGKLKFGPEEKARIQAEILRRTEKRN